jgi:RNA polymerase sigma factor (sigma-70 family)
VRSTCVESSPNPRKRAPDRRAQSTAQPQVASRTSRSANRRIKAVEVLVAQRGEFHRFLAARVGSATDAEDLLQQSLLKALQNGDALRRGERAVAWFYRILRNAVVDYYRQKAGERRRADRLWTEMHATGDDVERPPKDWDAAVCDCFQGLLPTLKPRYAELIRRFDLNGESKEDVGRELKIKVATLDVALHRARKALRQRLEILCGSCSREGCLACFCQHTDRSRKAARSNGRSRS